MSTEHDLKTCPCLACADRRQELGLPPLVPDPIPTKPLVYGDGCEQCEYTPGAYYEHAADCFDEEDGRPNLCSGTGAHFDDCLGQWLPCPECSPTPAAPGARKDG